MKIGVAYYPEHWPEERWAEDARLMREAGIEAVRLGEFAWWRLEPRRGQFDAGWLDRAIQTLAAQGLNVVLCTPTAAPPPWLFARHPSILPQDREGKQWARGSRRHVCLNNRPYRRYVRRILREVARAFAGRPEVLAWQIHTGLGGQPTGRCYCDDCEHAFREWLMRRYGIIARLNRLWGTGFWSQHFNDWHEVPAPRRTPAGAHPSLALDYDRFVSATCRDFVAEQRAIIEQYGGEGQKLITTNSLALDSDCVDQFEMGDQLDVAGVDNYPADGERAGRVALLLDLARGVKRKPFWVLEQQAGATTIPARASQPRPGQLRLWSFQAAARGAELVSYCPWRTYPFGQRMHWDGLLAADGAQGRRFAELAGAAAELSRKSPLWQGRLPKAPVAMVLDHAAHWALEADPTGRRLGYLGQFELLHGLLRRQGFVADVLPPGQDPTGYALLVVPMPVMVREQDAEHWDSFVQGGGTALFTAPAGDRTVHNAAEARPPGRLAELVGVEVVEQDVLGPGVANAVEFPDGSLPACPLCCILEPGEAEPVAHYGGECYAGRPAVTRRERGQGRAYLLGATGGADLLGRVLREALQSAGLEPCKWASETVEVVPLRTDGEEPALTFVLNHADAAVELALGDGECLRDLLAGQDHTSTVRLEPYGVVLLQG